MPRPRSGFGNSPTVTVAIRTERASHFRGASPKARVRITRAGGDIEVTVAGGRHEVALIWAIVGEVKRAEAAGCHVLHVDLADPWLPKALIQRSRRFRSPIMFHAVLTMHRVAREAGVRVVLSGPKATPSSGP